MSDRRVIVTASVGRPWFPNAKASVEVWASRVGAEVLSHTKPRGSWDPFRSKFDWMADSVDDGASEVAWVDDDVVVRADTLWPDYEVWGAFATPHNGTPEQRVAIREILSKTSYTWKPKDGYYNSGVVFYRGPSEPLREIDRLSKLVPVHPDHPSKWCPEQGAMSVYLAGLKEDINLGPMWNWRWPRARNGKLPGYMNHFLTHSKPRIATDGAFWKSV